MSFDRVPDNNPAIQTAELHDDVYKPEAIKVAAKTQEAALPPDSTVVTSNQGGLIKDIRIPGQWTQELVKVPNPAFPVDLYRLKSDSDVCFSYKYNGGKPGDEGNAIHKIMDKPDHALTQREIEQVKKGLYDNGEGLADWFKLGRTDNKSPMWTETINDHKVLFVEGVRIKGPTSGRRIISAYLDSDPSRPGRIPESLTYFIESANENKFEQYLPLAMKAFHSIKFKDHVDTSTPGLDLPNVHLHESDNSKN